MRDDKLVSPVISTYAIGGDASPPRRGAGLALPVIVVLGTASVAAIVSVSFEGETPIVADHRAAEGNLSPASSTVSQATAEREPVTTVRLDEQSPASDDPSVMPAGKAKSQDLPMLSVLQPRADVASFRPPPAAVAIPPARSTPRPPQRARQRDDALPTTSAECAGDCSDAQSFEAAFDPPGGAVNLDAGLSDGNAPLAADDRGAVGAPGAIDTLAADAAMTTSAPPVATDLLADSRPAVLAEPAEGLVAGEPDLALAADESPQALPDNAALAHVEAGGAIEASAAELQTASPAVEAGGVAADTTAASTIPQHIARIGERYASVPAAESAASVRSGAERAGSSDQPALVESTVAVDLGERAGSGVIVQDDELVAIRLGELVSLMEDRFDHPLYVWLSSSSAASKFVTAQTLAAAGIRTRYDPERRQLVISTSGE